MTPQPADLHVLIVDDEAPARERLRRMLESIAGVHIVAEATGGHEALALAQEHEPDLLILDINMPDLDGMRVLEAMDDPPAVVFSTAYEQYAVRAFEKEAVDYLLKPYSKQRLAQAVERARRVVGAVGGPDDPTGSPRDGRPDRIPAEDGLTTELVAIEDIVLLRIEEGVVFLFRSDGEKLLSQNNLQALEAQLPPERFFRANRQSILNLSAVKSFQPTAEGGLEIRLGEDLAETVSRRRARHFRSRMQT